MKIVKTISFILFFVLIFLCITYFTCYLIPSPQIIKSNQIEIYDKDNNLVMTTLYDNEGSYVKLENINEDFIYAFVSSEDEQFYNHLGFSLKGFFRALIYNIKSNTKQGGSTISQQVSRITFLDNEKSLYRKIKEAIYTMRIETHYNKNEIIEKYLNSIYLGHDIYGIQQASLYYFNKDNNQLTLDEVCLIVGIANAPNLNAPDINYQNAIERRNYVLSRMYKCEFINEEKYNYYLQKETKMNYNDFKFNNVVTPFYNYGKHFLKLNNLNDKKTLAKGIKIYTTLDIEKQRSLYNSIHNINPNDSSEMSGIIMESKTGNVLAMMGGYNLDDEYNRALYSTRPFNSLIKPLIYYLALKSGMNPDTTMVCKEMDFHVKGYDTYHPRNATNTYANERLNMIEAIGVSDNIYATKTLLYVGIDNLTHLLNKFNIKTNCVLSSALGVDETTLMNMVSIYNCFASKGIYYPYKIVRQVCDGNNTILYTNKTKSKRVLEPQYTLLVNQMLRAPFDENLQTYTSPTLLRYQTNTFFAAKTGSDNYNYQTIGFNPYYTIGIWSGSDQNENVKYKTLSKQVFQSVANQINSKNIWYTKPNYIIEKSISTNANNNIKYWFFK